MSKTPNLVEIISPRKPVRSNTDEDLSAGCEATSSKRPAIFPIVRPPRPFGYRTPVGHPEEENTSHPLRRRDDLTPLK